MSGRPGRLEAALARADTAEAMYPSLVEQPPAVTYSEALHTGETLSISPQIEPLLGCTQDEWMADPLMWVKMMHPDDRDRVVEACAESNRMAQPFQAEYRMIARDGRVVWIRDRAEPIRGESGQPLCWQGVMVDITALRRGAGSAG